MYICIIDPLIENHIKSNSNSWFVNQIKLSAVLCLLEWPLVLVLASLSSLLLELELFFLDLLLVLARLCLDIIFIFITASSDQTRLPSDPLNLRDNQSTVNLDLSKILQLSSVDIFVLLLYFYYLLFQEDNLLVFTSKLEWKECQYSTVHNTTVKVQYSEVQYIILQ